jgi:hypothetical protein
MSTRWLSERQRKRSRSRQSKLSGTVAGTCELVLKDRGIAYRGGWRRCTHQGTFQTRFYGDVFDDLSCENGNSTRSRVRRQASRLKTAGFESSPCRSFSGRHKLLCLLCCKPPSSPVEIQRPVVRELVGNLFRKRMESLKREKSNQTTESRSSSAFKMQMLIYPVDWL